MAWIELHQSLFTHRKTYALADLLGLPEVHTVGHLVALWSWSIDNAPAGVIAASQRTISRAAQWQGQPETFVDALVSAGFLDRNGDMLAIHDWDDYAGKLIDQRHANADRQRRHRERVKSETSASPNASVTVTSPLRRGATVPNPTVPNPTQPDHERRPVAADAAVALEDEPESKVKPAPKPNKFAEVIDALKEDGIEVTTTKADAGAVKDCSAAAALIAEAYGAAYRGDWPPGETWLRNNLNLQAVCKRIDGFKAYKAGGANGENGNHPGQRGTGGAARARASNPGRPANPEHARHAAGLDW